MRTAAHINRILEIDMDTDREIPLEVRYVLSSTRDRLRQPDTGPCPIADQLTLYCHLIAAAVRLAEAQGICKKGEGMRRTIELMGEVYAHAGNELLDMRGDEQGNFLYFEAVKEI